MCDFAGNSDYEESEWVKLNGFQMSFIEYHIMLIIKSISLIANVLIKFSANFIFLSMKF